MKRRHGYSIQAILANGCPVPKGFRGDVRNARIFAEEIANTTGLEVRVWNRRLAEPVLVINSEDTIASVQALRIVRQKERAG